MSYYTDYIISFPRDKKDVRKFFEFCMELNEFACPIELTFCYQQTFYISSKVDVTQQLIQFFTDLDIPLAEKVQILYRGEDDNKWSSWVKKIEDWEREDYYK